MKFLSFFLSTCIVSIAFAFQSPAVASWSKIRGGSLSRIEVVDEIKFPSVLAATVGTQEEWTPKRLHNTNWFRSGAVLVTLTLMGATKGSPLAALPKQAGALLHLLSFSTWFGTMVYTTFVLGITAFKNLPRQTFGKLQSKLFPKYFSLGSICLLLQVRLI